MAEAGKLELVGKPADLNEISNVRFGAQLDKLQRLRNFIISQSIKDQSKTDQSKSEPASIALGTLNSIRCVEGGREPTDTEWDCLMKNYNIFMDYLMSRNDGNSILRSRLLC